MKTDKIINHLRAGFSTFWLRTSEHDHVREFVYNDIRSFVRKDGESYKIKEWTLTEDTPDPREALNEFCAADDFSILFVYNWHWFADKPLIVQMIKDNVKLWSNRGKALVCVSHTKKIPAELEKEFVLIEMSLPTENEIGEAVDNFVPDETMKHSLYKEERPFIINACKGIARTELDNVLALSVVEADGKGFSIDTINEFKAQSIRKTGFLEVLDGDLTFKDVVGYENIKQFVSETITNPKAKGIMTIGPPGCGKTSLMKAIVGEFKMFGLAINMGSLFSKYQGETDQNINTAIDIIKSVGPCLVLVDEFEKQFAGAQSDGSLDSGTTRRATGRWLDFLQNRPEGVYIVGTANSFQGIPNEYLRPGRWDTSPFFIDYPTEDVALSILDHYCNKHNIKNDRVTVHLKDFSGAEIEALVHIADMRNIPLDEAIETIIPQAKTMGESINKLRAWAKDRTIPAEKQIVKSKKTLKRRKIDA